MNELKSKYTGSDENGKMLLCYSSEQLDKIKQELKLVNKQKKLLELKNKKIKLLSARLTYDMFDEGYDVCFEENSNALELVNKQINELELE